MCKVGRTKEYIQWLKNLKDLRARNRIGIRVRHFSLGNLGDVKSVGDGVLECRIHYGPGYRLYFTWREEGAGRTKGHSGCGGGGVIRAIRVIRVNP